MSPKPTLLLIINRNKELVMRHKGRQPSCDAIDVVALWSSFAPIGGISLEEVEAAMLPAECPADERDE